MKNIYLKYSGKGSAKEKGPKKKGFGYQVLGFGSGAVAAPTVVCAQYLVIAGGGGGGTSGDGG